MLIPTTHLLLLATLLRPSVTPVDSALSVVSTRADPGLILVARTSLAAFALLGLLAYAKRSQPGNDDGGRRLRRTPAGADPLASSRDWSVARRSRPGVHRVTATLHASVLDTEGQVVIPAGAVVELTITEVPQPDATTGGKLVLDVTGVMVHTPPSSNGSAQRVNGGVG